MNFVAFQDIISKIEGVINIKLVTEEDELKELHILASNHRAPKQIVRDIESALLAAHDYRIDRKVISIAQIDMEVKKVCGRIKYDSISIVINGCNVDCTVTLEHEGEEYSASQTAIKTSANKKLVVAKATMAAVSAIPGHMFVFDIYDVIVHTSRDINFVSVVVNLLNDDLEQVLVGSAVVKNDLNESIVKATLDAINRRVKRIVN
jgi:hypothetical protein